MIVLECQQGTHEWHEHRRGVPTASRFSSIVTPSKFTYAAAAQTYICELIAEVYNPGYGMHDEFASRAMRAGIFREPEARRYYEFANDIECQEVGFCLTDDKRFGASPDALIGEDGGIEIKSPQHHTQVKWLRAGEVPSEHIMQVLGCLLVTGREWWDFLSYAPPLPNLLVRVERGSRIDMLREYLNKFWEEYQAALAKVKSLHEPEPTKVLDFGSMGTVEVGVGQESYF